MQFGGELRDNEKVTDIVPGDIVNVKTDKALYKTRKLILTPGIEDLKSFIVFKLFSVSKHQIVFNLFPVVQTQTTAAYCSSILPTLDHHVEI